MTYKFSPTTKGFYSTEEHDKDVIPKDAVNITNEEYNALINRPSDKMIDFDAASKKPIIVDYPEPSPEDSIKQQIVELEKQQTARRIREAALGLDDGWLGNLNVQITELRNRL